MKKNWNTVQWTDWLEADSIQGRPEDAARHAEANEELRRGEIMVFLNSIYQVEVRGVRCPPPWGRVVWLSFKTRDKSARHDWREIQRIKNELVGEHVEAVELYPDEDRLVDSSNQYHLWCCPDVEFPGAPKGRFPFGYRERLVGEGSDPGALTGPGARQRPFDAGARPADTLRIEEMRALVKTSPVPFVGRCPICGSGFQPANPATERPGFRCVKHGHYMEAP